MAAQRNILYPSLDPAQIAPIWEAYQLGPVRRVVPISGGSRNTSYLVNDELVLRLNTRDPEFVKFRNEHIAYQVLAGSGLPLPTVIAVDETRTLLPYDLIILTCLPGVPIAASRATLSADQLHGLAWQAGQSLARIHEHTFQHFGKLHQLHQQPFLTWQAYFDDYARRYLEAAEQAGLIDDRQLRRLAQVQQQAHGLLAQVTQPVLVHSDFHYENLLHEHGALSGLLDFEWALAGDPAADFAAAQIRATMLPRSEAIFVAGYQSARSFDCQHSRRTAIYRLFLWLEGAVQEANQHNRPGAAAALAQMIELLDEIERRALL